MKVMSRSVLAFRLRVLREEIGVGLLAEGSISSVVAITWQRRMLGVQ